MAALSANQKQELLSDVQARIDALREMLETRKQDYRERITELKSNIPELEGIDLFNIDADSNELDLIIAKIRLYTQFIEESETVQDSPYFVRLDVVDPETSDFQTIYISKFPYKDENIFSWVAPIAALRYADVGAASYEKPNGDLKHYNLQRKDNYIITGGKVVFFTFQDQDTERQVVFQKHFAERRDFLLPEIVAELDKLQDQIIRSDPRGFYLISGPAGSGKTTLALHRIAYLVLTPEFKDFFNPERIVVFVATEKDIKYFSNLLPELGINGVRITTFNEWGLMIANSRFRAKLNQRFATMTLEKALEFISKHNPYPEMNSRLVWDEYRRLKQQVVMPVALREGSQKDIYPALHTLYTSTLDGVDPLLAKGFVEYLNYQKKNRLLDEVDLTIILMSLENAVESFSHVVIDEVQNWTPEQLQVITSFAHHGYKSVTFIGDIRQKTKVYTIDSWADIAAEFSPTDNSSASESKPENSRHVELLKVYRNTYQILEYLKNAGYDITPDSNSKQGPEVAEILIDQLDLRTKVEELIDQIQTQHGKVQIAVIGRYPSSIAELQSLNYAEDGQSNIHVMTAEASQGLEFHSVIIVGKSEFAHDKSELEQKLGLYAANQYTAQAKHLFYVAATRAQQELFVLTN